MNKMTLDEYLAKHGYASPISSYLDDKMRSNKYILSSKGKSKFNKEVSNEINKYHQKRNELINEYNALVASGKIIDKTKVEKLLDKAWGHPDNISTQSAKKLLTKMGIDWITGKDLHQVTTQDYENIKFSKYQMENLSHPLVYELYRLIYGTGIYEHIKYDIHDDFDQESDLNKELDQWIDKIIHKEELAIQTYLYKNNPGFRNAVQESIYIKCQYGYIDEYDNPFLEIEDSYDYNL